MDTPFITLSFWQVPFGHVHCIITYDCMLKVENVAITIMCTSIEARLWRASLLCSFYDGASTMVFLVTVSTGISKA